MIWHSFCLVLPIPLYTDLADVWRGHEAEAGGAVHDALQADPSRLDAGLTPHQLRQWPFLPAQPIAAVT